MKSPRAWVLSIVASLVVLLGLLIGSSESFQKCEHNRKDHESYKALQEENTVFVHAIVRLKLLATCARLTAGENDGMITALSGIAVAGFTLALWLSTEKLWKVATEQAGDMKRSIQAAESAARAAIDQAEIAERTLLANERAWVSVEVSEWTGIEFHRTGTASLDVTLLVKNIGKTIAINVQTVATMIANASNATLIGRDWANEFRKDSATSRLLLPQQSYGREFGIGLDNPGESGESFFPGIMACVTYQTLPDLSVHQTFVCYYIGMSGGGLLKVGKWVSCDSLEVAVTNGGWAD